MAASIITRAGDIAQQFYKLISARAIALQPDGDSRALATALVVISCGAGAPTASATDGSLYLRTDGTDGDDSLYMRIAGAWIALQAETA